MMTNLFSIFDPSTPNFLSSNWLSIFIFFMLLPSSIWTLSYPYNFTISKLQKYIFTEFKPLTMYNKFILIIPLSFFMFIMFNNLMGLFPYIFTTTAHMSLTFSMSLLTWMSLMLFGYSFNMTNILIHLIPQNTPLLLMPLMVLIETISNLIRPGTLAIRLSTNMIAGHLLISLLSSTFIGAAFFSLPLILIAQILLSILELAVAFIQAYIFSVLITLYSTEISL